MKKKTLKKENKMTLYEINQSIICQSPPYSDEQISVLIENLNNWDIKQHTSVKYYMLLNNEKHYYTVLHYKNSDHTDFENLGKSVVSLLKEMNYSILDEEENEDHYEIWVKKDKETLCYLLFPYDQGVVIYG